MKSPLTGKDPDAGQDWGQEEMGASADEMVGWHPQLNGHEFEEALGNGDGQGSLMCYSPWGHKESDMTKRLNNKEWPCKKRSGCKHSLRDDHVRTWGADGSLQARRGGPAHTWISDFQPLGPGGEDVCCLSAPPSLWALLGQLEQTKAEAVLPTVGERHTGDLPSHHTQTCRAGGPQ